MQARQAYFIFYVADQARSAAFYRAVLGCEPILDVPGITEFPLRDGTILGLIPVNSARRLVGEAIFDSPGQAPKAELYLVVDDPERYQRRAVERGAVELSPMQDRDWGHRAAYCSDPDGHVLAFADKPDGGE